jgi:hypothetical protein
MLEKQRKEPFLSKQIKASKYESSSRVEKYDIFFFEDLSPFLKSINSLPYNDDSVVEIPQGSFAIPFH